MNYFNYFTEIENHFVKRRGKHLLVSPMDWNLIAIWRDAGVPLQVALRGIDIAMDGFFAKQHRGSSKVNSLCYCHDSVMAEYAGHQESRVGEYENGNQNQTGSCEKDESGKSEVLEFLSQRIREIKSLPAKQYLSESVLEGVQRAKERLEEMLLHAETSAGIDTEALERDLGIVDQILMEELSPAISDAQAAEWEKEAKSELKVYKKRLPKEAFERIHRNFVHSQIRRHFEIGELSIFHL
jgi:hypothetical protein